MSTRLNVIALTNEQYARLNKLAPEGPSSDRQTWVDSFIDGALSQAEIIHSLLRQQYSGPPIEPHHSMPEVPYNQRNTVLTTTPSEHIKFDISKLHELIDRAGETAKRKEFESIIAQFEFAVIDETVMFRETKMATDFWPDTAPEELMNALVPVLAKDQLELDRISDNIYLLYPGVAPDYAMTDKEIIESLKFVGLRHVEIDGSEPSSP